MNTSVELTLQERIDILTDAVETGAIRYWAATEGRISITRDPETSEVTRLEFKAYNDDSTLVTFTLTPASIQAGVNKVLENTFQVRDDIRDSIVTADIDSEATDVIVQAFCFGEIIYG